MTGRSPGTDPAGPARPGPDRLHNVPVRPAPELPSGDSLRAWGRRGGLVLVVAGCLAVLVVTVWLDTRAAESGPGVELAPEPSWPYALNGVALALLAGTILVRSPRQPFG